MLQVVTADFHEKPVSLSLLVYVECFLLAPPGLQGTRMSPQQAWLLIKECPYAKPNAQSEHLLSQMASWSFDFVLKAARVASEDGASDPNLTEQSEQSAAAQSRALLCFVLYYDALANTTNAARKLERATEQIMEVVRNRGEPQYLRQAIITRIAANPSTRFFSALANHAGTRAENIESMLRSIVSDNQEPIDQRKAAVTALGRSIEMRLRNTLLSDPAGREELGDVRGKGDIRTQPLALPRGGLEVLQPVTREELRSIGESARASAEAFKSITVDPVSEAPLHREARRVLKSWSEAPLFDETKAFIHVCEEKLIATSND